MENQTVSAANSALVAEAYGQFNRIIEAFISRRIADRAEAIRTAVMLSRPGDIILVAGKGHETYQIVGDVKHPFDDREEIKKRFALLN